MPSLFSPAQANAALALVRPIVADVVHHQARLAALLLEYQTEKRKLASSQILLNETRREMATLTAEREVFIAELIDLGVQMKDPATGLVDFPCELDGVPVLLCWRLGEDRVEFFHGENEGFGGRRPLPVPVHA
jgi:hypothetical protein